MYELFNAMPFGLFVVIMLVVMAVAAFEIIKINREEPGAPKKYILYVVLVLSPILTLRRYAQENPLGTVFESILDVLFVLGTIAFVLSLLFALKKARNTSAYDSQKSTLKTIGVLLVVMVIFIAVVYFFM